MREERLMIQILANTPTRVFGLFFALLALGLLQARSRTVRKIPALLLPAGMVALSLAGIHSSFGLEPVPLVSWTVALALSTLVGYGLFRDERVACDATAKAFFVPGSWVPLTVIMAIFFGEYVYAVMQALHAAVISTSLFIVGLSAIYGLLSGYFAARALNLVKLVQRAQPRAATAVHL
jgi:hypothetical protein